MLRITLSILCLITVVKMQAQNYYIAHRGASYLAPENTLAAVNLAWESGADAVEIDVHLSADNRVVVIHDKNTGRTSANGEKLIVAETASDELRRLDVGKFKGDEFAGEKIPFIEEVLATIPPDKILYIEIKCGSEILPALQKAVLESGKTNQLVFISFSWNTILLTQNVFPNNSCYYLRMNPLGLRRKIKQVAQNQLAGVNLHHRIITPSVVRLSEKHNVEVLAWTVDKATQVQRLNRLGVNKITTNRPQWLKERLN